MAVVVPLREDAVAGPEGSLTLAELIGSAPLRGADPRVLCGVDRLDSAIRWVHAGEVFDIGTLLRGGELLLTTGLGIGSKAPDQRRFIDTVVQHGAVGIVLELGTAYREAPEALVARATERDFPLVVLGRTVRFVDVTEVAHRRILGGQLDSLHCVEAVHRDLMALMLDGADTAAMLEWLAMRLGISLSLVRSDGHLLFHAPAGTHSREDLLDAHARTSVRRGTPMALPVPSPAGGAPLQLMLPCHAGSLSSAEQGALTRACDLLALSLLRRRQEETLLARERGDFLAGLTDGDLSEREAETRARELGWTESAFLLPVVVAGRTPQQVREQQDSWAVIMQRAQQELRGYGVPMIAGLIESGDGVGALVGVPALRHGCDADRHSRDSRRAEIAHQVAKVVRMHAGRVLPAGGGVAVCVGEPAVRFTDAGERLREVSDLTPTSIPPDCEQWLDLGRPDIDLLVKRLLGNEAVERFVDRRLAALEEHDELRKSELIRTLEALFEHNGNKADTARALFLERQSLYSRLQRIEELLGESLADETTRLGLQLALHVRRSQVSAIAL
jgi:purine catabolism regulator